MAIWTPQIGPQLKAATCPVDFTFFGGSRGGGKSDCLIGRQIAGAERYTSGWNGLVLRRKYKEFAEIRRRTRELIANGLPAELTGGDLQTNYLRFKNGAAVQMAAVDRMEKVNDFVGHQYTEIGIDECTTFPFFASMVDKLRGSNRSPHGVPCRLFGTGNPGGPGHSQVKDFFKLGNDYNVKPETILSFELGDSLKETRIFIPSFLSDNFILCENDPNYVAKLRAIQDPALRRAWLDGDWDVFIGQAFTLTKEYHLYDNIERPDSAPIYMTFDWGWGEPFSILYFWIDRDGRAYLFDEFYGWDGVPQKGLRWPDSKIAEEVAKREEEMDISSVSHGKVTSSKVTARMAGHDSFNRWPNRETGEQGPSSADVFFNYGMQLQSVKPSKELKLRQFRERLRVRFDDNGNLLERPMLQVSTKCKQFIRTVSELAVDEERQEVLADHQEDHCYDSACNLFHSYPITMPVVKEHVPETTRIIERAMKGLDPFGDDSEYVDQLEEAMGY